MRLFALVLIAAGIAAADPICRTAGLVDACFVVDSTGHKVTLSLKALESQSDYLPITAFGATGRIQLSDGSVLAFNVIVNRDDWDGYNSVVIPIPTDSNATGVARLSVTLRRDDQAVVVY